MKRFFVFFVTFAAFVIRSQCSQSSAVRLHFGGWVPLNTVRKHTTIPKYSPSRIFVPTITTVYASARNARFNGNYVTIPVAVESEEPLTATELQDIRKQVLKVVPQIEHIITEEHENDIHVNAAPILDTIRVFSDNINLRNELSGQLSETPKSLRPLLYNGVDRKHAGVPKKQSNPIHFLTKKIMYPSIIYAEKAWKNEELYAEESKNR